MPVDKLPRQANVGKKDIEILLYSGWIQYKHEGFSWCKTVYIPSFTQQNAADPNRVGRIP